MQGSRRILFPVLLIAALVAGCSHGSSSAPPPPNTAPVSLTVTDAPPTNLSIEAFQALFTAAVLKPNNQSLTVSPMPVEITRLQTTSAFLSTTNVAPGTYSTIEISLANPDLTFKNDTGATITAAGVTCLTGTVCEIKPAAAGTVTLNLVPPLVIVANNPTGLQLDINPNNLISSTLAIDFTATSAYSIAQLPLPGRPPGQLDELDDLMGTVANKDATNNKFTLQTTLGNFTASVDGTTQFQGFTSCPATDFTCVTNGQVVKADLRLQPAGTFLAKTVEFEDAAADDELEGVITTVDSATQFKMVVLNQLRAVAGVNVGNPITVTLQAGATFPVDTDGLTVGVTVPAGLKVAFEGATDTSQLIPGQEVEIRVRTLAVGPPITVATNRVRLRFSRFTATVSGAPAGSNFNVGSLPSVFTSAGITLIQVQTSAQTVFEGVTDVTGIADGQVVSLDGLLFKAPPNTILVADKVRKRS